MNKQSLPTANKAGEDEKGHPQTLHSDALTVERLPSCPIFTIQVKLQYGSSSLNTSVYIPNKMGVTVCGR